jgi:hypothetical protein
MPEYEEITTDLNNEIIVRYNEDGSVSSFMKDPANSDYQEYLKSLDEAASL